MLWATIVLKSAEMFANERLPFLEFVIMNSMKLIKQSIYSLWVILSPKSDKFSFPPASVTATALVTIELTRFW